MKKCTTQISLSDLMGEDYSVWLTQNKKFGFDLHLDPMDDYDGKQGLIEEGLHPYAVEGLADFCKRFLWWYEKINRQEAA